MALLGSQAAGDEWRRLWPHVLAATIGFSFQSLAIYATGLFMQPLQDEFGWSRAEISAGVAFGTIVPVLFSVPVGILLDKWGVRRIALPGLVATACVFSAFGTVSGNIQHWYLLWGVFTLIGLSIKSTVWSMAVAGAFNAARGAALGVTMCGAAVAQIVTPPLAYALIEAFGWRAAFAWLGFGWGGVALTLCFFFLVDTRPKQSATTEKSARPSNLRGLSFREAIVSPPLIRIAIAAFLTMFLGVAAVVHQVPILTAAGMARGDAAYMASLAGFAGIAGKLMTGWITDRFDAGWVSSVTLAASAIGFLLLLTPSATPFVIVPAMLIIGYSTGAKLQICTYLTSRYAGMKNFGSIYGVMSSMIALASGMGPMVAGYVYDETGGYVLFLWAGAIGSLVAGLMVFKLGPFPDWGDIAQAPATTSASPAPAAAE